MQSLQVTIFTLFCVLSLLFSAFPSLSEAKRKAIEEIPRRQLDSLLQTEDYLAVFWQSKNCKTCDRILSALETRNVELEEAGVKLVQLNDKKAAKSNGVLSSPGLTYFKGGDGVNYEGDFADTEALMDFLANPESMELPDKIEEVNANQLDKLVKEKTFVAVFFYNAQQQSKDVLQELENVDGKADNVGIAFVKINDLELVDEYNLASIPAIVYFRHATPILYQGDLMDEAAVLEWLIQNRSTGDEDDVIEDVDAKSLDTMIQSIEHLAVLFYDPDSRKVDQLLETLERIDDDCAVRGIHFVKVAQDDKDENNDVFGIDKLPKLVYFNDKLPNMYEGNLLDAQNTLQWLLSQADSASIEEVTGTMMDKLIKETKHLVVLFCKYIGYAIIALTHTCYLLKHYTSTPSQHSNNPPVANGLVQNGDVGGGGRPISPRPGSRNANLHPNAMQNMQGRPISPLAPPTYLPAEKVKGLAKEI